jgi:hypothetical protein
MKEGQLDHNKAQAIYYAFMSVHKRKESERVTMPLTGYSITTKQKKILCLKSDPTNSTYVSLSLPTLATKGVFGWVHKPQPGPLDAAMQAMAVRLPALAPQPGSTHAKIPLQPG